MLGLHDGAKLDADYQKTAPQIEFAFPAGSSWMCFTDQAMHAALKGQFALEQTFHLPVESLGHPERSPLKVLERMMGRSLSLNFPLAGGFAGRTHHFAGEDRSVQKTLVRCLAPCPTAAASAVAAWTRPSGMGPASRQCAFGTIGDLGARRAQRARFRGIDAARA